MSGALEHAQKYRGAWEDYEYALERLADEIEAAAEPPGSDDSLNGREWCDQHDIPEVMFAHAVELSSHRFDWGVSPMYPWVIDDE